MNQGSDLKLTEIRCCASCKHYRGERVRHRLGECHLEAGRVGGKVRKTWATELCYRYTGGTFE